MQISSSQSHLNSSMFLGEQTNQGDEGLISTNFLRRITPIIPKIKEFFNNPNNSNEKMRVLIEELYSICKGFLSNARLADTPEDRYTSIGDIYRSDDDLKYAKEYLGFNNYHTFFNTKIFPNLSVYLFKKDAQIGKYIYARAIYILNELTDRKYALNYADDADKYRAALVAFTKLVYLAGVQKDFSFYSFSNYVFENFTFEGCDFARAAFNDTILNNVKFKNCKLSTLFRNAKCDNVIFENCIFTLPYVEDLWPGVTFINCNTFKKAVYSQEECNLLVDQDARHEYFKNYITELLNHFDATYAYQIIRFKNSLIYKAIKKINEKNEKIEKEADKDYTIEINKILINIYCPISWAPLTVDDRNDNPESPHLVFDPQVCPVIYPKSENDAYTVIFYQIDVLKGSFLTQNSKNTDLLCPLNQKLEALKFPTFLELEHLLAQKNK